MKKILQRLLFSLFFMVCVIWLFFTQIQAILVSSSTKLPSTVDAIVVLGGGSGDRVSKAIELLKTCDTDHLIFTGGPIYNTTEPQLMQTYALSNSQTLPPLILEEQSQSTKDHPIFLTPLFKQHNIQTIIIITSAYHTARTHQVFKRYVKQENLPLTFYICASNDGIDYNNWWKHHEMVQEIGFELIKRVYYSLFVF